MKSSSSSSSLDRLSSAKNIGDLFMSDTRWRRVNGLNQIVAVKSPDHIRGANTNVHANYDDNNNTSFNVPVMSSSSWLQSGTRKCVSELSKKNQDSLHNWSLYKLKGNDLEIGRGWNERGPSEYVTRRPCITSENN